MRTLKKNTVIILVVLFTLGILAILTPRIHNAIISSNQKTYEARIFIQTFDRQNVEKKYQIELFEYGDFAMATPSFLNSEVVMTKGETYYLENGRYKRIISQNTYRDLRDILKKMELKEKEVHYNLNTETINEILECLFINYRVTNDMTANIEYVDKKIDSFHLYMNDVLDLEKLNITIKFYDLDTTHKYKEPFIYDEMVDKVDASALQILNLK